jgi:ATP-dependent Lhr-like helicase
VLGDGEALAYLDRAGRHLIVLDREHDHDPPGWLDALTGLVKNGRLRRIELDRIDGAPARTSPWATTLTGAGFAPTYRGLVLHP